MRCKKHRSFLTLAFGLISTSLLSGETSIYVSANGNDSGSGSLASPYATLMKAQKAVRQTKRKKPDENISVILRGGFYSLTEKLVFTAEDSGSEGAITTWRAYPDEKPVISGGQRLLGNWKPVEGKPFYRMEIPEARDGAWKFRSLSINHTSRTRARKPNEHEVPLRGRRGPAEDGNEKFNKVLRYDTGDVDPNWTNPEEIDLFLVGSWTPTIHRLAAIDPKSSLLRFESSATRTVDAFEPRPRYYLENIFEALDQPGEWYLNSKTGILYYYPMPGEKMDSLEVIAPKLLSTLIEFRGEKENSTPIRFLRFEGIAFANVDGDLDKYNGVYRQADVFLSGGIAATGLTKSIFSNCEFSGLGEYAMVFGKGCQDVRVQHSHFFDIGAGAVLAGLWNLDETKKADRNERVKEIRIDNNFIHHTGTIWPGTYAVGIGFAENVSVTHNEITDIHWCGIGIDARWEYHGEKYSHGHRIEYNHVHHYGTGLLTDTAGFYQFGPLDTQVRLNRVHDGVGYPFIAFMAGIYLDEMSCGALVEKNLVYRTDGGSFNQHWGTNNVFQNNIGAFGRDGLLTRGGLNNAYKDNQLTLVKNIYLSRGEEVFTSSFVQGANPTLINQNIYWNLSNGGNLLFGGRKLSSWQATGFDADSLVTDPGFIDPEKDDFRFKNESLPALKNIGFEPFGSEIQKAGLYGDEKWTSLPNQFKPRVRFSPEALLSGMSKGLKNLKTDFEDIALGDKPEGFTCREEGLGTISVSDEAAAGGKKSLRIFNKKGLSKNYLPFIFATSKTVTTGHLKFSVDYMQKSDQPAGFNLQIRKDAELAGPSIAFQKSGAVEANGQEIATVPPGTWAHLEIEFDLGMEDQPGYQIAVSFGEKKMDPVTRPFLKTPFTRVTWLGFAPIAPGDETYYLDNFDLSIQ